MATIKLHRFFDEAGNAQKINTDDVFDKTTGKYASQHMSDAAVHHTEEQINGLITSALDALNAGDIQTLKNDLDALEVIVNEFLTGEDNNNETIDRLKELVAAINDNKDSIDALLADKVAKTDIVDDLTTGGSDKALSAEQGKVLKGSLDSITGQTGIAFGATLEAATSYTGKIRIVVEDYEIPSA